MKKFNTWLAFISLILMVSLAVSCKKDEGVKLDFDITVPTDWKFFVLAEEGLVYSAQRNQTTAGDTLLPEYLSIFKDPIPGYTLNTYYTALKNQLLNSEFYVSTIEEKDTTIDSEASKRLVLSEIGYYIKNQKDTITVDLITNRYLFYRNDVGYNFTFVTLDTLFYRNKAVFTDIIGSLKFKN